MVTWVGRERGGAKYGWEGRVGITGADEEISHMLCFM